MTKNTLFVVFSLVLVMQVHSQNRLAPPNDPYATARSGQAEIIINASNAEKDIAVWVNGSIVAHIPPKSSEKIIVNNGRNLVEVADTTVGSRTGQWNTAAKKQITVNSNSDCVTIGMTTRYGALLNLSIQNTAAIGGRPGAPAASPSASSPTRPSTPPPVAIESDSIENAVYRAAWVIIESLPNNSTVAVLSISSDDLAMAEFVIEELAFLIVDTKKFKVVDRRSLDAVRSEAQFQYSGDVDDHSAVSIGKMLGASVVVTGSVSGSGATRRLRAKALDVETAEILAMASERF